MHIFLEIGSDLEYTVVMVALFASIGYIFGSRH